MSAVSDLVWAMQWLDSLTDDLNTEHQSIHPHPRTLEFLKDLEQRRINNHGLHAAAKEANL